MVLRRGRKQTEASKGFGWVLRGLLLLGLFFAAFSGPHVKKLQVYMPDVNLWIPGEGSEELQNPPRAILQHALPLTKVLNLKLVEKYKIKQLHEQSKNHSLFMHDTGIVKWVCTNHGEKQVTKVMVHVFQNYYNSISSSQSDTQRGIMLDVGANAGYYGIMAASYRLPAVLFDLQPECVEVIQNSIFVNGFGDYMRVIPKGVSEGGSTNITVPDDGCDGQFPFKDSQPNSQHHSVELHPLSYYFRTTEDDNEIAKNAPPTDTDIVMMKVDTEGNEKRVLNGALPFFEHKKIKNAIVEVTPGHGFWKKAGACGGLDATWTNDHPGFAPGRRMLDCCIL